MSKTSNISSLSELRERREAIKAEQQAARNGLTSTLAAAPQKAKEYALEDLALPALGVGLTAYLVYRILRSKDGPEPVFPERPYVQPVRGTNPQPQSEREVNAAHAPLAQRPAPVQQTARQEYPREVVKKNFSFAKLITAGKLLVPAAQAIIGVIQSQQSKAQTKGESSRK